MMCFRNTLLPVPEGPSITVILPLGMSQVMSSKTVCAPNVLVSCLIPISASGVPPLEPLEEVMMGPHPPRRCLLCLGGRYARSRRQTNAPPVLSLFLVPPQLDFSHPIGRSFARRPHGPGGSSENVYQWWVFIHLVGVL